MVDGVSDGRLLESSRCCSSGAVEQDRKQETLYEAWNTGGISQFTAFVNLLSGVRILKVKIQKPVWEGSLICLVIEFTLSLVNFVVLRTGKIK